VFSASISLWESLWENKKPVEKAISATIIIIRTFLVRPKKISQPQKRQAIGLPEAVSGVWSTACPVVQIPRKHEDRGVAIAEERVQPPHTQLVPLGFL